MQNVPAYKSVAYEKKRVLHNYCGRSIRQEDKNDKKALGSVDILNRIKN